MAESSTGLVRLNPDGTIGLTIAGTRHSLKQITLGELRTLRDLYNDAQAEVTDHLDFEARPTIQALETKIKGAKTAEGRKKLRAELAEANNAKDQFVQGQWARWWRECIGILSSKELAEADADDPADGLEPWMVDSPRSIPPMFQHWRAVPLAASQGEGADVIEALTRLGQLGQLG